VDDDKSTDFTYHPAVTHGFLSIPTGSLYTGGIASQRLGAEENRMSQKKMASHAEFEAERRSQPIARLEIHSPSGRPPSRAEITSALSKLVKGRFTLSLQSPRADRIYVTEIFPVDAIRWFSENCDSFSLETSLPGTVAISATVHWEEIKRHLSR
jgi:hypothetical protein